MSVPRRARHRFTRLAVSLLVGLAVGVGLASMGQPALAIVGSWTAGVLLYCLWVWVRLWRLTAETPRSPCREQGSGRGAVDLVLVLAAVASVGAVAMLLSASRNHQVVDGVAAVACVAASWFLVHTVYGVRYADRNTTTRWRTRSRPDRLR